MENKLPKNWVETELGEILKLKNGYAFKTKDYREEGIPLIRIGNIKQGNVTTEKSIYVDKNDSAEGFIVEKGDVLVAMSGATTGKYGVFNEDIKAYQNQRVGNLKPFAPDLTSKQFIYYLLGGLRKEIEDKAYGGAQPNISPKLIETIKIGFPPLAEQQRIVAKLDELFGHLDVLKTRLNHIPQILKNFRQAVLTQAVTGKLTEEWRVGKALEEWVEVTLQDITKKIGSGSTPRGGSASYKEEGIPLVRSMNIHFNGIKSKGLAFIDEEQAERLKNVIIEENDILLNITGASIGRVCIAEENVIRGRVNQHVTIIRLKDSHSSEYINMYLASSIIQNFIFNENYGVTRQALTKTQTQNLEINLPPKEEQAEIVKRVEHLFAKADAIEAQYQSLKIKIDSLPQAILAKAFKGELVKQLDTDCSAEVLLEEIERLKAELKGAKKTVSRKKKTKK
jgi:type I restriction enzyme S subunit